MMNSWLKTDEFKRLYPFKSHFLGLGDHNLHYVDEGSGQPMLMLHGNPTWSFYYRNLVKSFSGDFRTIVPDHMGCGLSDKPQDYPYSLDQHIMNAYKLIRFLDLKDIILVVHDWGGAIGFGLLTRYPELFSKVIILNTAAFPDENIPSRINLLRQGFLGEFLTRGFNLFAWPATFMTTTKTLPHFVKKAYIAPYNTWKNRVAVARFVQDIPMEEEHPTFEVMSQIEAKIPSIKIPKLILWGGKDFCFNKHFYNRWLEFYPQAQSHYYEDAGHYIIEDELEDAIDRIWNFIS